MNYDLVSLDKLVLDPKNPRTISTNDFESLQRSLDLFGWVEPIVVNKRNNIIVGGHQRYRAARALRLTEAPVAWVDLDADKHAALNIALNKISGEWDDLLLREMLETLSEEDKILTGWSDEEITKLEDGWVDHEEIKSDKKGERKFTIQELETLASVYLEKGGEDRIGAFIHDIGQASEARQV